MKEKKTKTLQPGTDKKKILNKTLKVYTTQDWELSGVGCLLFSPALLRT